LPGVRVQVERALEIGEAIVGPDDPTLAEIRGELKGAMQALHKASPKGPSPAF
jgi:hypothetical protein